MYFILYMLYLVYIMMYWLLFGELFFGKLISECSCYMYRYRLKNGVVFYILIWNLYGIYYIKVKEMINVFLKGNVFLMFELYLVIFDMIV